MGQAKDFAALDILKALEEYFRETLVEASNVINDPKCNKGPKCNTFWP